MKKFVEQPGGKLKRINNSLSGPGWEDNFRDPEIDRRRIAERKRTRQELRLICQSGVCEGTVVELDDSFGNDVGAMNDEDTIETDDGGTLLLMRDQRTGRLAFASFEPGGFFA
ncbi:MAG: hypothetical protein AB7W16_12695 [Candidatus Obscuribacterales bacterium]